MNLEDRNRVIKLREAADRISSMSPASEVVLDAAARDEIVRRAIEWGWQWRHGSGNAAEVMLADAVERLAGPAPGGPADGAYDVMVSPPATDGSGALQMPVRLVVPAAMRRPLTMLLRAAAERIEQTGWSLGQPVNYSLEIAGVIVGEDLGYNR